MSGVATTVEENRALKLSFEDSTFSVVVGFSTEAVKGDVSRSLWTFGRRSLPSSVSCTLHLHAA